MLEDRKKEQRNQSFEEAQSQLRSKIKEMKSLQSQKISPAPIPKPRRLQQSHRRPLIREVRSEMKLDENVEETKILENGRAKASTPLATEFRAMQETRSPVRIESHVSVKNGPRQMPPKSKLVPLRMFPQKQVS